MVTQTETIIPTLPEFAKQPTADIAKTLEALLGQQLKVPQQQVAGFSPTQTSAMNLAMQGIGSFQPFLQAAQAAQTAGLGTIGTGAQIAAGADFSPGAARAFMDPYQQAVTQEALKEVDRQAAMAQNQLAGQAVKAGAFGRATSGIGGAMAGLGGQLQQQQRQDVNQLLGIGGLQQQQAQREFDVGTANIAAMQNAPFQRLSTSAGILQQLLPNLVGQQTIAPFAQPNPYAQMAGLVAGASGLAGLL
jgi:hypothetical protein